MTTASVTIPAEVADTIERLRNNERDNAYITELALRTGGGIPLDSQVLRTIPFDTLLAALVNGYERDGSEEERRHEEVRRRYVYLEDNARYGNIYAEGACREIVQTLDTLGIQIEGVNAS
ncbi:hypothetical protein ACFQ3Y_24760 [Paenibacillus motobuensis]|uniref:hypothetical protein n=1 Tax=Paenibacillus motobuensis TaxID=295324 RepID=UPI00362DA1F0